MRILLNLQVFDHFIYVIECTKVKFPFANRALKIFSECSLGAIGGTSLDEVVATAEIELEDCDKEPELGGIVAVESPEMDMCDINNPYSSDILKYFSPPEIRNASVTASTLDNKNGSSYLNISVTNNSVSSSNVITTHSHFTPYFLAVEEEILSESDHCNDHERQLLSEYKAKSEDEGNSQNVIKGKGAITKTKGVVASHGSSDNYEKTLPKHGDIYLYKMISTINRNPGQVIR